MQPASLLSKVSMPTSSELPAHGKGPSAWLILSLAIAGGATAANLYYSQPLVGTISASLDLSLTTAGLLVTVAQVGYALGLVFLVPLGDVVENKSLILTTLCGLIASLLICATAPSAGFFIMASLLMGVAASGTQMIVPLVAHLTPERIRGQTVGTVVSGLIVGMLLARPLSTLVAGAWGWRAMYLIAAAAMCAAVALLAFVLPRRRPEQRLAYPSLIRSLWDVVLTTPLLQRRAAYQALVFAVFTMFWTGMPILLQAPPFSLGPVALSAFLLSGVVGAFVAPWAGRLADHGHTRAVTGIALSAAALSYVLTWIGLGPAGSITVLVIAGSVLDAALQANIVAGQRVIYTLSANMRSRLNALYLALSFVGGALGSAISGYAVSQGTAFFCTIGIALPLVALAFFATEFTGPRK